MSQPALQLGRAGDIIAAPSDKLRVAAHRAATGRALALDVPVKVEWLGMARPLLFHDANDSWNDLARLFHDHGVADADVLTFDFLLVVERGAGDGGSGEENRFEFGDRYQRARAADLNGDILEPGRGLLAGILVGDRIARRFGGGAEPLPLFEVVDLDDRAVDF